MITNFTTRSWGIFFKTNSQAGEKLFYLQMQAKMIVFQIFEKKCSWTLNLWHWHFMEPVGSRGPPPFEPPYGPYV